MNSKQGIILYAKHWFEETDLMEDLRKLWEIDYNYCCNRDICQLSMIMLEEIIKEDINNGHPRLFLDFLNDCQPDNQWKFGRAGTKEEKYKIGSYWHNVLSKFLSIVSLMDKSKLEKLFGPLCKPDYSILPMSKQVSEEGVERIFKDRS
jgi:hypothetical protein